MTHKPSPGGRAALLAVAFALATVTASSAQPNAPAPAQNWQRFAATEVQMHDLAAIVRVVPEKRSDVALSVVNPGPLATPALRLVGRRLVIDGRLGRDIRGCRSNNNQFQVDVRGRGRLGRDQLPQYEVHVPEDAVINGGGAVRLQVGRARTLNLDLAGCGDTDAEGVTGAADVAVAGGADLRLYDAGSASVRLAGSGDVTVGVVRTGFTVSVAGSGDVLVARADGPTNVALQGSGDVTIRDGHATTLSVAIAGSGDFRHGGSADRLDAAIVGSGDVSVRQVNGPVARRVFGSGGVTIGR